MPGEGMLGAVFRHIGLAEDIPGNSLHALVGPGDPGDLAFHGLVSLPIVYLTRFLHANRFPPPDQVRGHASLENAIRCVRAAPESVSGRRWDGRELLRPFSRRRAGALHRRFQTPVEPSRGARRTPAPPAFPP